MTREEIKAVIQEIHDRVYEQGKADGKAEIIDMIINSEKNKFFCNEDLCDGKLDCSDCRIKYLRELKENK